MWFTVHDVADLGEARSAARDAVVRPLSRAAGRPCARPGCPVPARATLSFRYATREAWVETLGDEPSPATYDLCAGHADRTRPPHGWALVDQRPAEEGRAADADHDGIGGEHTVAVLAAALRAVPAPDAPSPRDVDPPRDVDQPRDVADVTAEVRDALSELQAVARATTPEPVDPSDDLADELELLVHAVEELAGRDGPDEAGTRDDVVEPRPVPAARERRRADATGSAADAW